MNLVKWRYAVASVAGSSHERKGIACQDAGLCRIIKTYNDEQIIVAVASDGAGSAQFSHIGSALACDLWIDEVHRHIQLRREPDEIGERFAKNWIECFQQQIRKKADQYCAKPREFACTVLAVAAGNDWAAFMQIGDGAIVTSTQDNPDLYHWIFWPDNGEYANCTYFATESDASKHVRTAFKKQSVEKIALFTDGLQMLSLHYQSKTAFQPFFRPMFEYLDKTNDQKPVNIDLNLAAFLKSPDVNARSDDDKTLIIASRRGG